LNSGGGVKNLEGTEGAHRCRWRGKVLVFLDPEGFPLKGEIRTGGIREWCPDVASEGSAGGFSIRPKVSSLHTGDGDA